MYEDGARMRSLVKGGHELLPQGEKGLEALKRSLLSARIEFPISKNALMKEMSWRTIDLDDQRRIHADEILGKLPEKTSFESLEEVITYASNSGFDRSIRR